VAGWTNSAAVGAPVATTAVQVRLGERLILTGVCSRLVSTSGEATGCGGGGSATAPRPDEA
ncbi:hypothetical protein ACFVXQ_30205, partial [Kitasatospora sp. NPDC058263]